MMTTTVMLVHPLATVHTALDSSSQITAAAREWLNGISTFEESGEWADTSRLQQKTTRAIQ